MEETQEDKSNAPDLYSVCVFGKRKMVKDKELIKRDTEGKCVRLMALFSFLIFFNATSNNKAGIRGCKST